MKNLLDVFGIVGLSVLVTCFGVLVVLGYKTSRSGGDSLGFAMLVGILTPFAIIVESVKQPIRWIGETKRKIVTKQ